MCLVLVLLILAASSQITSSSSSSSSSSDDAAFRETLASAEPKQKPIRLLQRDPREINYEEQFTFSSGKVLKIKTLAKEPPLFEIPGFLSAEECDHIKDLALEEGLFKSTVRDDREGVDDSKEDASTSEEAFTSIDANQDGVLDALEILDALDSGRNTFLRSEDAHELLHDVHLDPNGDGVLSLKEFIDIDSNKIKQIREWTVQHTQDETTWSRVSEQTWLSQDAGDKVLDDLRQRVVELTGLPRKIIDYSEHLQVVYYTPGGHFHAHYDSSELEAELECSHTMGIEQDDDEVQYRGSRPCRFITILYYLDDTLEGGETAFPIADNGTFREEDMTVETHDLSHHCHDANLYVRPEKGKAVMWYNHYINATTGWLGEMNPYSLHGGCDVKRGTKWLANNWINVDDSYRKQKLHMESLERSASGSTSEAEETEASSPDDEDELDTFMSAVRNITGGLARYLQTPTGRRAVGGYFTADPPNLDRIIDVLVEYVITNAIEVRASWLDGYCDYDIIWDEDRDGSSTNDGIRGDLAGIVREASAYGRRTESIRGAGTKITLKNPKLSSRSEKLSSSTEEKYLAGEKDEL